MSIIQSSIRYPVTVIVGVLIAVIAGYIALQVVPVQLTPEVERPTITVETIWPGASPEEVEKEIVEKQEEYLKSIEGVLEMSSESQDSYGSITLEFPVGVDISSAFVKVSNKLNEVPFYPETADKPVIRTSGPFDRAIGWFVVKAIDSTIYLPHIQTFLEDMVKPRMERVEGVSSVNIFGGLEQECHVIFDPDRLASSGITISQLTNALRNENRNISAGDFSEGKRRYVVRTISRYETLDAVNQTIISNSGGIPIRVMDVADVEIAYQKPTAQVRHKGQTAIAFNAQRQIGANVIEVMDELIKQMGIINKEIMIPRGMVIENVYSETVYINSAIDLVFSNIYIGGILAILTLFVFLRSKSAILVIGVSIPISIITTFLAMKLFGRTINVISLAGMAFAVGMVVDSSIVVLENIYRHLQMGKERFQAALDAAREVWGALLASAVTTIAVFLPILFVQERAGQLFKDIAIAIASAIAIALVVSITVIPSMSARVLRVRKTNDNENKQSWLNRFADRISNFVYFINAKTLRRLLVISSIVLFSVGLTWVLLPDAEYLPNGNQNFVFGFLLPPPGYNIDEVIGIGKHIEDQIRPLWETEGEAADTLPGGGLDNFFYVSFPGQAFMGMRTRDASRASEIVPIANQALWSVPGAIAFASQQSIFGSGFAGTRSVRIDISGPELNKVIGLSLGVFQKTPQVLPGSNARPIPALDLGNPEVRVIPDRVRAADMGFTAADIGRAVNAIVDGSKVSEYFHQGRELDLILKGRDDWSQHTQSIAQLPLATPGGRLITVGDVAEVKQQQGPVQINHIERQRTISISVSQLPDNLPLEKTMGLLTDSIITPLRESGQIGGLYDIKLSGTADDLAKLRKELFTDFNLAILLTFLLLAALFQSFTYPLVVMLTVPLATFGGVMGLRLVKLFDASQQLDILTMLGFVILVGTVINNSILIVYHAIHMMREGMDSREAVKESVRVRVRPIFMSTSTSALGMLPLIIMPGAGSELYRGLGSVVVGGLAVSTVITLLLTPLVFSFTLEIVARIRRLFKLSESPVATASDMKRQST